MDGVQLSLLVIDEDPRSRNYLSALLTRQNYEVKTVSSGKEGYISALRDRPDVIIFDPGISDIPAIELIKKLRTDKRTSVIACIALAASSDTTQMGALMAAGCNEYLFKTQESIDKLLKILAAPPGQEQETGPLLGPRKKHRHGGLVGVFLSAKGGTGTSSMCANIAQCIATIFPELDVAVMDLVLPIGSLASIVGYQGDFNILTAASHSLEDLKGDYLHQKMLSLENWNFRLLAGSPDPGSANSLDAACMPVLINAFRQTFDLTLVDLGRSLSRISLPIILDADVVVIVTGTDLATLTLTKTVSEYLKAQNLDPYQVYLLINRSVGLEGLSKSDAEHILDMEIRATVPYLGGTFSLANNQHLPIMIKLPNDTAAMMIDQISREIMETARHNHA
jgi:MinD-like ATPase involved in chromosome partitioning or flagellar assembly/ActR/RegA family two-component response regulator